MPSAPKRRAMTRESPADRRSDSYDIIEGDQSDTDRRDLSRSPDFVATPEPEEERPSPDVVLDKSQRSRMVRLSRVVYQKSTAELEAEYALRLAGEQVDFDPREDLRNLVVPPKVEEVQADPDGWRIIVHDIFVENFKSYRGRQQLGPLHKNLTMIVGPNGSGKSNVIDALLFVFGFKAKKIRSAKLTALINDKGDSDTAKVEVHFIEVKDLDDEKYKISSKPPLVISRSINKRDHSSYTINGALASPAVVTRTLQQCGIDLTHNRFLILQGEVESIAQMPPTSKDPNSDGMLEYIEDIVGTNRYKKPIEKVKHGIKLLELKTSGISAGVRYTKSQSADFKTVMDITIEALNAENNVHYILALIAQTQIQNLTDGLANLRDRFDENKAAFEEARDEENELRREQKELEHKERCIEKKHREKQKQQIEVSDKNDRLRRNREKVRMDEEKAADDVKKIQKELEEIEAEFQRQLDIPGQASIKVQNLRIEAEQFNTEKLNFERLEDANKDKFTKKAQADKEKVSEAEKLLSQFGELSRQTKQRIAELDEERSKKIQDVEVPQKVADLLSGRQQAMNEIIEIEKKLAADIVPTLDTLRREIEHSSEKITKVREHREQLIQRRNVAKSELSLYAFENSDGKNQGFLHRKLIELEKKGELKNFIGRMGELASIDREFDAAMSTVFPGNLDHFVVRTSQDAIVAIDLLNHYKYGRGHFFCMDRLDNFTDDHMMNKPPTAFPAKRLFDQIQFPDDILIKRAFYHFMGNTLVTKTIDEAKRIDQRFGGRYLICTYEGAIIDQSGNLTGGGTPLTGRMNVTGANVGHFNNDIEKKNHIFKTKTRMQQTEREINSIEMMLNNEKTKLQADKARLAALEREHAELIDHRAALKSKADYMHDQSLNYDHRLNQLGPMEEINESIQELDKELEKLNEDLQKQEAKQQEAQQIVNTISHKIGRMWADMVTKNTESKKKADDNKNALEREIANLEAIIENNHLTLSAIQAKKDAAIKRLNKKQAELEKLSKDDTEKIVNEQAANLTLLNEVEAACRELKSKLDEVKAEKKSLDDRIKPAHQKTINAEAMFKDIKQTLESHEEQIEMNKEQVKFHEKSFKKPEDLGGGVKFVRVGADDFAEQVADDALVMPEEVYGSCLNWEGSYWQALSALRNRTEVPSQQQLAGLARSAEKLEAKVAALEHVRDNQSIAQYCSMVSLTMNAKTREKKYATVLAAYRRKLNELKNERFSQFMEALVFLGSTTQMLYQMITNGGDASLKFMEEGRSSDPFEGGVGFNVRPAKKSWKEIKNLSGGEKTLASLCFVFAMHHFRSTPLYVMDEIDAALDQVNVRLIANYIKFSERTRNAQFMIISLRNQMFEMGPRLIGIYKVNGQTKNIVINPNNVENSKKWGNEILEKRRQEASRRVKAIQDAEVQQEMEGLSLSVKRPKRKALFVRVHDFLNSDDSDDEEEEEPAPNHFVAFGAVPRLPGAPSEDEVPVEDDTEGPPAKRRPVQLPTAFGVIHERAPTAEEAAAAPVFGYKAAHEDSPPAPSPESARREPTPEDDDDALSVASYMDFEEEGDAPIQKKKKRVVEESSDVDDTPVASERSSRAPSASPSRSPARNQPSTSTALTSRRGTRRSTRK